MAQIDKKKIMEALKKKAQSLNAKEKQLREIEAQIIKKEAECKKRGGVIPNYPPLEYYKKSDKPSKPDGMPPPLMNVIMKQEEHFNKLKKQLDEREIKLIIEENRLYNQANK
ncbi:MAG: hypothetical protein KAJ33_01460 [Thermoplasmata archaeon]|nr:hypothetical protein [Thermoplasmata archaeon]